MRAEDRPHVARAVWDEFCKLSGESRDMTCAEGYVLSKWLNPVYDSEGRMIRDAIPLPVILRAFGEFAGRPRRLGAMEGPVNRAFAYYRQAMAL